MDHMTLLVVAAAAAIAVGVTASVCLAPELKEKGKETELVGEWTQLEFPTMTTEAQAAFDKAMEGLVGVNYVPVELLGTQVVAGTNYRILCNATGVYPGAEPYQAIVTIYQDLDGNAKILEITELKN